ncbi:ankyrin repeat domain-containing protein 40-like [Centruroides vittatus]|uniref:ankyrin repeat domain-containing protein 40-like n=1 Tax=Centruroides vittatus TaxID=120091 RepID=UPI0035106D1C
MDAAKLSEEKLREASCFGDEEAVRKLIERGVNINAQHEINGWTALHWASKRNHKSIVSYLLGSGADKSICSSLGEVPAMLTDNEEIRKMLGGSSINSDVCLANLAITPNYIAHPPLGYKVDTSDDLGQNNQIEKPDLVNGKHPICVNPSVPVTVVENEELVLKVRLANSQDPDFIEIEIPRDQLTYNYLLQVCCIELNIDKEQVSRIRKLPNTVLRKDKDIQRLNNFQELEVVLTVAATTTSTQTKTVNISTTKESESSPIQNKTFLKNSSAPPPPGYLTVSNSPVTATKNVFEKSTFCKNGTILY